MRRSRLLILPCYINLFAPCAAAILNGKKAFSMSRKQVLIFFGSVLLLIVSEYLLLTGLMISSNVLVLVMSCAGLLTSIFFIIRFYNEWRNSLK
jgi:cytochrome c oxidase subunit IV